MKNTQNITLKTLIATWLLVGVGVASEKGSSQSLPVREIIPVSEGSWQPEGFVNGTPVPVVWMAEPELQIDGLGNDAAWDRALEVEVPLSYGAVERAWIKALYTDAEIFIRVRWPDATENREHHPWEWSEAESKFVEGPQIEDSVLLSFEAGCEWTPSLLGGYMYDFDAWQWLAARSDPVGQALDLYGNVQDRSLPEFDGYRSRITQDDWILKFTENQDVEQTAEWQEIDRIYMLLPVSEDLWVKAVPDGGQQAPEFVEQLPPPSADEVSTDASYPQFSPIPLSGSAGEVKAKGSWEDGYWTVEFRRDLHTPAEHIYDTIFNRLVQFSVHVFDGVERLDQVSESGRLFLQFMPKEEHLVQQ